MPRPPQRRWVIAQAGQSDSGLNLAAKHADVIYAQAPRTRRGPGATPTSKCGQRQTLPTESQVYVAKPGAFA